MGAFFGLAEVVTGTAHDHVFLVVKVMDHNLTQGENTWYTVHQSEVNHVKVALQGGVLEELVQGHLWVHVAAQFNHNANPFAVGFVAKGSDAIDGLFLHEFSNFFNQARFVDLVRNFGDDDAALAVGHFFDVGAGAHGDGTATGEVGVTYTAKAHDNATGWEVRRFDDACKLVIRNGRIVNQGGEGIGHFAQVVGWHVGCHPNGNPRGAVNQKIWEAAREDGWFFAGFVVGWHMVHGFFFDVAEHFLGQSGHAGFGITLSRSRVTVDVPEVPLTVHHGIAQAKRLCQTYHGFVHGSVAVWVVVCEYVPNDVSRLAMWLVRGHVGFVHRVEDAAVNRL